MNKKKFKKLKKGDKVTIKDNNSHSLPHFYEIGDIVIVNHTEPNSTVWCTREKDNKSQYVKRKDLSNKISLCSCEICGLGFMIYCCILALLNKKIL